VTTFGEIEALFAERGAALYFGEAITEEEHALQSAALAEDTGAGDALVVAALLHDVGHLLHDQGEDVAERGEDARHEEVGHAWLAGRFGPEVCEPARLHVAAKRFLCATDPSYVRGLSPASRHSLELQGGPMRPAEVAAFEATPHAAAAARLRRWDDGAKVVGLDVPGLDHYRVRIEKLATR
jgi:phosphonate degradation associated HDIG domain protein